MGRHPCFMFVLLKNELSWHHDRSQNKTQHVRTSAFGTAASNSIQGMEIWTLWASPLGPVKRPLCFDPISGRPLLDLEPHGLANALTFGFSCEL